MATLPRPPTGDSVSGDNGTVSDAWNRWFNQIQLILNSSLVNAPSVAPYIIQTTNALLSNAQVLANLNTGFVKVTNGTGILSSQAQINSTDINPAGVTGTGLVVFQQSPTIKNANLTSPALDTPISGNLSNCTTGTPGSDTALANKVYVDTKLGNIVVDYTTIATDVYTVTYAGTGGVGDTMTFTTTGVKTIDGVNIPLNKKLLITAQADTTQNGVYLVTTAPAVGVAGILTRSTLYDTAVKINAVNLILTVLGTSNNGKSYSLDNPIVTIGPTGSAFTYTLAAPYVPPPTATTLGGVLSIAAVSNKWINSISTLGSPTLTQPAFTNISGTATGAQGGSLVLISKQTASASTSIDFTTIASGTYNSYLLVYSHLVAATNTVDLWIRISQAGVFLTTSIYSYSAQASDTTAATGAQGAALTTNIAIIGGTALNHLGTGANSAASGQVFIQNCAQTTNYKMMNFQGGFWGTDGVWRQEHGAGVITSNTAIDGFRVMMSSGNITSGTVALYGIQNV